MHTANTNANPFPNYYTVSKKRLTLLFSISLPNINQF